MRPVALLFLVFLSKFGFGQDLLSLYSKEQFIVGTDTLQYRLLMPDNYKPYKKYPLIVFLHGSGERGSDNEAQLKHGGSLFVQDSVRKRYPAIVIFPQCPAEQQWTDIRGRWDEATKRQVIYGLTGKNNTPARLVAQLVQRMVREQEVDEQRIYLGGLSLGGFGTFALAAEYPDMFAAAFPICGGGEVSLVERYNPNTAWWLFHGAKDNVVNPQFSRYFYKTLKQKGFAVQYTEYPEAQHDSWTQAFKESQLLPWLFTQKLK